MKLPTHSEVLSEINLCLNAAKATDNGEDLSQDDNIRALAGYGLREVSEYLKPMIPALNIARGIIGKNRAKV